MNLKSTKNPRGRFRGGMLRRAIYMCSALLFLGYSAYGQSRKVTGTVTTTDGSPLAGVTVVIEGTSRGTVTDGRGTYSIEVINDNNVLRFSFMGMTSVTETVGKRTVVNVRMEDTAHDIEAVIVEVGYGQQRKVDLTGSVGMISGDELLKMPVSSAAEALTGKIAGLSIVTSEGSPGADISVKIRGGSSINNDNSPLYIIDGFEPSDGLASVDMTQIESISVLKDASSTAVFGSRGANGVILVTTKKAKSGKLTVSYNGQYSVRNMYRYLDVMTPYDFIVLRFEQDAKASMVMGEDFTNKWGEWYDAWDTYGNMPGVNWQKLISQTGNMNSHNVQVSGGSDQTRFITSISWVDETGVLVNTAADKMMARLRVTHDTPDKKVKLNFNVDFTESSITGDRQYGRSGKLLSAVMHRPTLKKGEELEEVIEETYDSETMTGSAADYMENPVVEHEQEYKKETKRSLKMQGSAEWFLFKSFSVRASYALTTGWNYNDKAWLSRNSSAKKAGGPYAEINHGSNRKWQSSVTLNYNAKFGDNHKLSLMAGNDAEYSHSRSLKASASKFKSDAVMLEKLQQGQIPGIPETKVGESSMACFFMRAIYNYDDRYLVTATMRADGCSTFGPENRWGYFPSVSGAWRLNEENFLKNVRWIDQLKLRASYGLAGNNRIPSDLWRQIYTPIIYGINDNNEEAMAVNELANGFLRWEAVIDLTFGFDFSFFNNRFGGSIDLYKRSSKDLLLKAEKNAVSGYTTMQENIGLTENKGLEISINTVNIHSKSFMWTTDFNISFNRNIVKSLAQGDRILTSSGVSSGNDYIVLVGQPVGSMYGFVLHPEIYYRPETAFVEDGTTGKYTWAEGVPRMEGVDDIHAYPGMIRFVDFNGDGKIDADDRQIIGNAQPKFSGGINNQFMYKGFDLSAFFSFTYGNDIYNANRFRFNTTRSSKQNLLGEMRYRFMTIDENNRPLRTSDALMGDLLEMARVNQNAKIYAPFGKEGNSWNHSGNIEDGSYLRLSQLTLGYTVPKKLINKIGVSSLRAFFTASNLWTWTNYSGFDPEVDSYSSKDPLLMGMDYSAYPKYRAYTLGMNLTF